VGAGIAIGYGLVERGDGIRVQEWPSILIYPCHSDRLNAGHYFAGVRWPANETGYSPPTSAVVGKAWVYPSIPRYVFILQYLVNHRGSFTKFLQRGTDLKNRYLNLMSQKSLFEKLMVAHILRLYTPLMVI
jgi:hypothetical protein